MPNKPLEIQGDGQVTTGFPGLFVQTASKTINTLAETSIFGTGSGNLIIPANYFDPGTSLRIESYIYVTTPAALTILPTITLRIKLGGTTLGESTATNLVAALTDRLGSLRAVITARTTGANGQFMCGGVFSYAQPTGQMLANQIGINDLIPSAVNTTIPQTLDVTAQIGGVSVLTGIQLLTTIGIVERI